jgi:hypothetical protein
MYCAVFIPFLTLCKYPRIITNTVMVLMNEITNFPFCDLELTSFQFWALFLQAKLSTCKLSFNY